ncbi:hypothetical protein ACHAQJ_003726 [Trichoderma viride]
MPRKFKTPDSNAQNRESQRRSRARRRELIDDLSRQLDEYKHRGVEATLEMQYAARSVFAENMRLRALLNLHGISEGEISQYLSSPDHTASGISKTRAGKGKRTCRSNGHSSLQTAQPRMSPVDAVVNSASSRCQDSSPSAATRSVPKAADGWRTSAATSETVPLMPIESSSTARSSADAVQHHCQSDKVDYYQRSGDEDHQDLEHMGYFEGETAGDILPSTLDCFCPPGPSTTDASRTEALETSCDTAAAILVELHDQTDAARARIALGCTGTSSCSVRNTTIFRLMDELGGRQLDP